MSPACVETEGALSNVLEEEGPCGSILKSTQKFFVLRPYVTLLTHITLSSPSSGRAIPHV